MSDPNNPYGQQPPQPPPGWQQPSPGGQPPPGWQQPPPNQPPPGWQQPPPNQPPPGWQQPPPNQPPPGWQQAPAGYGYPAAPLAPQGPIQAPPGMTLEPSSRIYIPAGTELASVGRRIGAYFLSILLFIVTLGIGFIIWGMILWSKGTSPALRVLGMKCYVVAEGRPPTFWRMALRDVIGRIVDGILSIITGLISFIMFVTSDKRQSLHDVVGGTTVLYDPNKVLG